MANDMPELIESIINENLFTDEMIEEYAEKIRLTKDIAGLKDTAERELTKCKEVLKNYPFHFAATEPIFQALIWVCDQLIEAYKNTDYTKIAALKFLMEELGVISENAHRALMYDILGK